MSTIVFYSFPLPLLIPQTQMHSCTIIVSYVYMCVFIYTHSLLIPSSVVHIYMGLGLTT